MMIATAFAVAFIVYSCKGKLSEAEHLNLSDTPVQTVDSMFVVQTRNGGVQMRVEADVMERYENDTCSYELFPKGLMPLPTLRETSLRRFYIPTTRSISKARKTTTSTGLRSVMWWFRM